MKTKRTTSLRAPLAWLTLFSLPKGTLTNTTGG